MNAEININSWKKNKFTFILQTGINTFIKDLKVKTQKIKLFLIHMMNNLGNFMKIHDYNCN